MDTKSEASGRSGMSGRKRTLATVGTLALALLGIPTALVLGTQGSALAFPGGGGGTVTWELRTTPSVVAPGDPVTVRMIAVDRSTGLDSADLTSQTQFSISPQDTGSCVANVCTPTGLGTFTIYGQYSAPMDSDTESTTITSLAPDHLLVSPVYTNATAGQTIAYSVHRAAADGTILDDVTSGATVTLGGVLCPAAVCTAALAGQQTLTATYEGLTAGGAVLVQPAVTASSLVVTPHVLGYWNNVWAATFTAGAVDAGGNPLGDATLKSVFTISPDGTCTQNSCTPATGGPHTVTASAGAVSGSVTLDAAGPVPLIAPALAGGTVGTPYSSSVLSWNGAGPSQTTLEVHASTPPGLTLGADGVLSGTPTAAGTYSMRIDSTNASGTNEKDTTITIAPAPAPTAKPTVSVGSASVAEGNSGRKTVPLTVRLSAASSTPVTVSWHTANGTAVAGKDYVAGQGTLTIPAGQLTATVSVSVVGDKVKEKNETFTVVLTAPQKATLGTAKGTVTISNDD